MGKSYVENSLKRFLKRKVKITLGLVVAFMITGMVSLGAETEIKHEEHKNHWEWNQVDEAEKYISQKENISVEKINKINVVEGITLETNIVDKKLTIDIEGTAIKSKKYEIDLTNASDETKKHINSTLKVASGTLGENENVYSDVELGYKYAYDLQADEKDIFISEGVFNSSQQIKPGQIHINKGFINAPGTFAQAAGDNGSDTKISKIYNLGVINGNQLGRLYGQIYNYGIVTGNQFFNMNGNIKLYNYGILLNGQFAQNSGGEIFNFGLTSQQKTNGESNAYNYGTIDTKLHEYSLTTAQVLNGEKTGKGKLYNYGLLFGKIGQLIEPNADGVSGNVFKGEVYNYGSIISEEIGQANTTSNGTGNNKIYNFGEIKSKTGQNISEISENNSAMYNYGTITSTVIGQKLLGKEVGTNYTNNKVYNYGTINAGSGVGQYLEKSGEIYNFGIIKNDGTDYAVKVENGVDEKYKAENYGVIDLSSKDNGKAFSGNIINRGFVITQNGAVDNAWTGENKGVILKNDLTLGSADKNQNVIDLSGKTGDIVLTDNKVTVGTNDLTDTDKTTVFMKNQNAQLTGTEYNNKNILAVVDDKNWNSSEAIIQAKDGTSLDLTNTVVTGYFAGEKGGTVLSTNSDLTLVGDTVISAVKGENVKEDVYALSLEKGTDGKSPMLTFVGNAQINGKINGKEGGISNVASHKFETTGGEIGKLQFRNANKEMLVAAGIKAEENYTNVTVGGGTDELIVNSLELSFRGTAKDKVNTVVLEENVKVTGNIDGTNSKFYEEDAKIPGLSAENKIDLTVNNLSNITGNITLGECDDKITVNNVEYSGTIDGNLGNDTLAVNPYTKTRADLENKLNYNIKNIETVELGNGNWTFGENLNISSDNADKNVTVKTTGTLTSYIGKDYKGSLVNNGNADITVAGQDKDKQGTVKYLMGQGFAVKDSITLDDVKIGENAEAESVVIYDSKVGADGKTTLTLKSAEDMGIKDSTDKKAYEILLGAIEGNDNLRNEFNGFTKKEDVVNRIEKTEKSAKAYYTSGYVVTKNIADTYSSIAEDFSKKAGKGEWLAQGKYINSDTEFDGGSKVKGYDGDITGTVGMIEYGVSDQASYGAVFGMGDTEVDIDGGGKLDGDNSYIGAFVKYRTLNGIDLIGNIGFAKSDLDSKLSNEFTIDGITGSSVEFFDGSADSKAITLSLIGKKDFHIADTVRLQPKAGVRYNFIQQEEAKNEGMGFRIAAQDVTIIEGLAGMGIVKDIDLNSGKLALNTGVEYTMSNASKYDEMEYTLYGSKLELENSEMADSRGLFYVGFDYEHERGVGFNGKYEMIWSDTGDDSRVTAGVSYRF